MPRLCSFPMEPLSIDAGGLASTRSNRARVIATGVLGAWRAASRLHDVTHGDVDQSAAPRACFAISSRWRCGRVCRCRRTRRRASCTRSRTTRGPCGERCSRPIASASGTSISSCITRPAPNGSASACGTTTQRCSKSATGACRLCSLATSAGTRSRRLRPRSPARRSRPQGAAPGTRPELAGVSRRAAPDIAVSARGAGTRAAIGAERAGAVQKHRCGD